MHVTSNDLAIDQPTKADFDEILSSLSDFWGDRHSLVRPFHHPMFFYEFGDTALVIMGKDKIIAYLLGMIIPQKELAYIHMVGVRTFERHHGLGRKLYSQFFERARLVGCRSAKAITLASNTGSIAFHKALGFSLQGEPNMDGIPTVRNYRGPGEDQVVFSLQL